MGPTVLVTGSDWQPLGCDSSVPLFPNHTLSPFIHTSESLAFPLSGFTFLTTARVMDLNPKFNIAHSK